MDDQSLGALSLFHPIIAQWFLRSFGPPTDVQARAWPEIAAGSHVLVAAPTGTGKTLAAFLWGINQLVRGVWRPEAVRILYISPLKALNNDIQRNLLGPLEQIARAFEQAGERLPAIRVSTRSGDTLPADRRRMLRKPPEILITTPESLNLLLSTPSGRSILGGLATVILDEIHAVAATKRGTHLITAVDRLALLSGEFQRVALSATVKPLSAVAELVGGFIVERGAGEAGGPEATYTPRRVRIVDSPMAKRYEIAISFPAPTGPSASADSASPGRGDLSSPAASPGRGDLSSPGAPSSPAQPSSDPVWDAIAAECRRLIAQGRSTLLFVNSRRHAEKLARFINEGQRETIAWSHHGSLSRELRLVVEQRLKRGELKAIVATSSLELGIDVGALDRVILVQTPFSISSAIQRLGRAGHRVGEVSRGVILPLHGKDLVDAAVSTRCVLDHDIERIAPVSCPLDVLSQVIVSMTSGETWQADRLFDFIRSSFPYHTLPRRQFDLVLDMLAGGYEQSRVRSLAPMVSYDRLDGSVRARDSARLRLATSGGTIPDRGYFSMRAADSRALIGELDEEFVWERSVGDTFVFGTQGWRIQRIDHQNVEVVPAPPRSGMSPFWKAEERNRQFHLSERIAGALEDWNPRLSDPALPRELASSYAMEPEAAEAMLSYLKRQREVTGADLPHRHHLLVEHTRDPQGKADGNRVVLHTMWGGQLNRPYSLALSAAWEERFGYKVEMFQTNDAILLFLPEDRSGKEILSLVTPSRVERLLRRSLEGSGFFGARFRESAGRALLLPRASVRARTPLWLTRLRAQSLLAAVSGFDDFPLVLESWRTCLLDEFDLANLGRILDELASGAIRVSEVETQSPSPFCSELVWKQTNTLMYRDDTPRSGGAASARADLVRELALSPDLRPRVSPEIASAFQSKLQRTAEGYAPRDERDLLDWLKERILVPAAEWEALLAACQRDHGTPGSDLENALERKMRRASFGESECIVAAETMPRIARATATDAGTVAAVAASAATAAGAAVGAATAAAAAVGPAAGGAAARTSSEGGDEVLAQILAEWLRYYGPVRPEFVAACFAIDRERLDSILEDLVDEELVVLDRLLAGSEELLLCDRENLEALLRISRSQARPVFQALPIEHLPFYLARRSGVVERGSDLDSLKSRLERLFGYALPARLWEEEVLPARVNGYRARWLDSLLGESGLLWLGFPKRRIAFCLKQDAELFTTPLWGAEPRDEGDAVPPPPVEDAVFFPSRAGRYSFWDLAEVSHLPSEELSRRLWDLAWTGKASSDSFEAVRRGLANAFRVEQAAAGGGSRRRSFDRWQSSRPSSGYWFLLEGAAECRDALDEEEIARDRIRLLLQRYGVVFREMLEGELPELRWSRLFRSLRLMEFSGEVVAGRFFEGAGGIQFALPAALEELAAPVDEEAVWWVNAADPASLCGVDLPGLKALLPARLPTTHLVFHGRRLVLVSRRMGRELDIRVPADSPRLRDYLGFLTVLTGREQRALAAVRVQTINGEPAARSAYRQPLLDAGLAADYRGLVYRARV